MERMEGYDFPAGMMEMDSEYKNAIDEESLKSGF